MPNTLFVDRRALSEVFKDFRTLKAIEELFGAVNSLIGQTKGWSAPILPTQAGAGGSFVNVYDNAGTLGVRLADATDPTKFCNGFILDNMSTAASVMVVFAGMNLAVSPAVRGQVWLSETTPGGYQTTPPSGSGHIIQPLGVAIPGVGIAFQPAVMPVQL